MTLYREPDWTAVHRADDEKAFERLVRLGVLVPVEPEQWFIEREHGERVDGPYDTQLDALQARVWIERLKEPETFWIRAGIGGTP
jgi:hypothetical protein